jgi:uncharacterized integral membrane protein (TIGR00698 family)
VSPYPTPAAADLFGDLLEPSAGRATGWRDYWPGLALACVAALAAAWISEHYGAPLMLMGLLFGLAFNFANADPKLQPGLGFASRGLLRWGIVLLGFKVSLSDIAGLGFSTFLAVATIVPLVILSAIVTARALRLGSAFGLLAGGAVAICGASAALAFAALLGEKRASQAQLTLTLVAIATASAIAMSVYPIIAALVGLDDVHAGFVMGASIHDVAQALGAGYSISETAGDTATIVKLTRVALLVPALGVASIFLGRQDRGLSYCRDPRQPCGLAGLAHSQRQQSGGRDAVACRCRNGDPFPDAIAFAAGVARLAPGRGGDAHLLLCLYDRRSAPLARAASLTGLQPPAPCPHWRA